MRPALLALPLACLLACVPFAFAGDPTPAPSERSLFDAVARSPLTLIEGVGRTYKEGRTPLRAGFVLDTEDNLVLRVLISAVENERRFFEEWTGRVHEDHWVAGVRVLEDGGEIAEAVRLLGLIGDARMLLSTALTGAVRTKDQADRPADLALAAAPTSSDGETGVFVQVGVDGALQGLAFDPDTGRYTPASPGKTPSRVPVDVRTLPALVVPEGQWFNTEQAPSLPAWRGHPVLVLVTSPG